MVSTRAASVRRRGMNPSNPPTSLGVGGDEAADRETRRTTRTKPDAATSSTSQEKGKSASVSEPENVAWQDELLRCVVLLVVFFVLYLPLRSFVLDPWRGVQPVSSAPATNSSV